ncbi:MAG: pyridoxamine 5'-phosphate oxidase family protein [Hahellaceae bacterium]|nr:pyridoxamine 5'-phosphate oxidase family protein [Hahellaceae bacterium]MCP5170011.1 pyridoxamine 5'-phosphate oxidase family protein [Hahellaceae bacterium]
MTQPPSSQPDKNDHTPPINPEIQSEAIQLLTSFKTLQLATLNPEGYPEASYTPFIKDEGTFYIFISELASHTRNLHYHPHTSIFFIQDERDSKNLFARIRLSISANCEFISNNDEHWAVIMEKFKLIHGPTIEVLMGLPDFNLVALTPTKATFVKGFGKAFRLNPQDLTPIEIITGK